MPDESTAPDSEELLLQRLEALTRRDFDAFVAVCAPDAVWDTFSLGGLVGGPFEGREAIRRGLEEWLAPHEDFEAELEDYRHVGNGVTLSVMVHRGRPTGSSGFVEIRFATVATWTDGLIERLTSYTELDEARAAGERLAEERG